MVDEVSLIKKIKKVAETLKSCKDSATRERTKQILKQSFLSIRDQLSPRTRDVLTKSLESLIGEKLAPGPAPTPTPPKEVRYAIMSDVHANIQALQAAYADIQSQGVDQIVFLGDLVGYGGNPVECFNFMRTTIKPSIWIRGNHDEAAYNYTGGFRNYAEIAIKWTQEIMGDIDREFLHKMLSMATDSPLMFTHGSPGNEYDNINTYILLSRGLEPLKRAFGKMPDKHICFIGHVHEPAIHTIDDGGNIDLDYNDEIIDMNKLNKVIINVGSVGQPRDGDSRACYVLFTVLGDNKFKIKFRRGSYEIEDAQKAIITYWNDFCKKHTEYGSFIDDYFLATRLETGI